MSLADYFARGLEIRSRLEEIDSVVHIDREIELQHLFHQLQLSDGAPDTSFSMAITLPSPNRASLLSLCFPEKVTDNGVVIDPTEMIDGVVLHDEYRDEMNVMTMSQITSIVQFQPVSPFDMFGMSTIEVVEKTQTTTEVNVVPVPKKDDKVRVCVDFRDLNKASPKDDFSLPHIDLLVDSTVGHLMLSFIDGFS